MLELRDARPGDLAAGLELLARIGLPAVRVRENWRRYVVLAETDGAPLVGLAGYELQGRVAVVRSVAVTRPLRGQGHGRRLVTAIVSHARCDGADEVFLGTRDAAAFYRQLGFEIVRPQARSAAGLASARRARPVTVMRHAGAEVSEPARSAS